MRISFSSPSFVQSTDSSFESGDQKAAPPPSPPPPRLNLDADVFEAKKPSSLRALSLNPAAPPQPKKERPSYDYTPRDTQTTRELPALDQRTEKQWQDYVNQWKDEALQEINYKRGAQEFNSQALKDLGKSGAPFNMYPGGCNRTEGKDRIPLFVVDFPSSEKREMQLYAFPRGDKWVSFDVSGNMMKAYNDKTFTGDKLGSNSALGYPDSGLTFSEPKMLNDAATVNNLPFLKDPEVKDLVKNGKAGFQVFQEGFLVDMGGGKIQAFKKDGSRMGTPYPGGAMAEHLAPTGPGSRNKAGSVYQPFEVAPGVSVNGRMGFSWPNDLTGESSYDKTPSVQSAADIIHKARDTYGLGYTTMVMGPGGAEKYGPLLKKLKDEGITPVVRLYVGKIAPDEWGDAEKAALQKEAIALAKAGVSLIQIGNEPNIADENNLEKRNAARASASPPLKPITGDEYLTAAASKNAEMMLAVRDAIDAENAKPGTNPKLDVRLGLPPPAPGTDDTSATQATWKTFQKFVDALADKEASSGKTLVDWLPVHNYTYVDGQSTVNHEQQGSARGMMGWGPNVNHAYEDYANSKLKHDPEHPLKALSTEGGTVPDATRKGDNQRVKAELDETLLQLNGDSGLTSNLWLMFEPKKPGTEEIDYGNWSGFPMTGEQGPFKEGLASLEQAYKAAG